MAESELPVLEKVFLASAEARGPALPQEREERSKLGEALGPCRRERPTPAVTPHGAPTVRGASWAGQAPMGGSSFPADPG